MHPILFLTIQFYLILTVLKLTFCDHIQTDIHYNVQWLHLHNLYSYYSCKATLMTITKVIKTRWIINVIKHIIHAQLLVLLHKFKYSFNAWTWNILSYKTNFHYRHMYIWAVHWVICVWLMNVCYSTSLMKIICNSTKILGASS